MWVILFVIVTNSDVHNVATSTSTNVKTEYTSYKDCMVEAKRQTREWNAGPSQSVHISQYADCVKAK